jgi:hypothetical protein
MKSVFKALPTETVRALQAGAADAYGMPPERKISDGDGVPCRHCLKNVGAGEPYLVLAYRPFPELQPYAETGPIFLHASGQRSRTSCPNCSPEPRHISCAATAMMTESSTAPVRWCRRPRYKRVPGNCWPAATSPIFTCARLRTTATSAGSSGIDDVTSTVQSRNCDWRSGHRAPSSNLQARYRPIDLS